MKRNIKWRYLWSAVVLFLPLVVIIILGNPVLDQGLEMMILFAYYLLWMWPVILIFLGLFVFGFFTSSDKNSDEKGRGIRWKILLSLSAAGVLFLIYDYWSKVSVTSSWWWNWVLLVPLIVVLTTLGIMDLFSE